MAHTIYVGKIAKRKNSTLQPTLNQSFDVLLKSPTSLHTPTFSISAASFDYNYLKWGDRYYFVTDVVSKNNGLWEVSAICDVLATYKADIIASTQFVSYSSQSGGTWLPDTRIPVLRQSKASYSTADLGIFDVGRYILSVVGESDNSVGGCTLWACTTGDLRRILDKVNDWNDDVYDAIDQATQQDYSSPEAAIESLTKFNAKVQIFGNGWSNAPSCIRSCIWVPFSMQNVITDYGYIYLGDYNTQVAAGACRGDAVAGSTGISIPWHFNDWRRSTNEDVYLYLPLVGLVSLSSDSINHVSSLTIRHSFTIADGVVTYEVLAGGEIIGTFGGSCAANYPLGINQQASAGQVIQTILEGANKTASAALYGYAPTLETATQAASALYNTIDVALTKNVSCVGGIGGGAGAGLDLLARCYTVAHDCVISPSDMAATMGLPTMKPMALTTLTGYCQCANAHVAATGAESEEMSEIDAYLNSGFYIE